jgi:hypothetical protein
MRLWGAPLALVLSVVACGDDAPAESDNLDGQSNPPPTDKPFCGSETVEHKLCADFDNGPVEKDWTVIDLRGGGAVAAAPDPVLSLPSSAAATGKANSDAFAYLVKSFPGAPSTVHVAFDVRVEQPGDDKSAASILDIKGAANHDITFNIGNAGDALGCSTTEFVDIAEPVSKACPSGLKKQVWAHFDVTVNYAPGGGNVVVRLGKKLDGEPFIDQPLTTIVGEELKVSLGARPYIGTGDWRVHFDNVVID